VHLHKRVEEISVRQQRGVEFCRKESKGTLARGGVEMLRAKYLQKKMDLQTYLTDDAQILNIVYLVYFCREVLVNPPAPRTQTVPFDPYRRNSPQSPHPTVVYHM
jgi:hypothetical protein